MTCGGWWQKWPSEIFTMRNYSSSWRQRGVLMQVAVALSLVLAGCHGGSGQKKGPLKPITRIFKPSPRPVSTTQPAPIEEGKRIGDAQHSVKLNMTEEEVVAILGQPTSMKGHVWTYVISDATNVASAVVKFENKRVINVE